VFSRLTDRTKWTTFDTTTISPNARGFQGGAFDGRFVYFVPYYRNDTTPGGMIVRHDATRAFTDQTSWEAFDIATIDARAKGYTGAAFDGRFLYLAPTNNGAFHGVAARYDTALPLGDGAAWTIFDLSAVSAAAKGFLGAIYDGGYVYFVPHRNPTGFMGRWPATIRRRLCRPHFVGGV
jgi:hypothetical protein